MKKIVKISLKVLGYTLCSVLVLLLAYNSYMIFAKYALNNPYPTVFGYSNTVVVSGSMEPTLHIGDMIIVKRYDTYQVGDIISFKEGTKTVTHRIVEVTENGYITWGDNRETNNVPDDEILASDVYGKVIKNFKGIGTVIQFFKTTEGIICLTLIIGLGFALITLIDKLFKEREYLE